MGSAFVSSGAHWRIIETDSQLQLLPGRLGFAWFIVVAIATECAGGVLMIARGSDPGSTAFFLIGGFVVLSIIGGILFSEMRAGAYFTYDARHRIVEVPRSGVQFPLATPMNFRIAVVEVAAYDGDCAADELWLDVIDREHPGAFKIVASFYEEAIERLANQLSAKTGIPLRAGS